MSHRRTDWIDVAVASGLVVLAATVAVAEGGGVKAASNETASIAVLRNLVACQAQLQTSGRIDADGDGVGEYGTFLELTGSVGVRNGMTAPRVQSEAVSARATGSTFRKKGKPVSPAIMSSALANVDALGFVEKNGYAFTILLPDTAIPAGFVHETGPADRVGLAGGTGAVGIDLSEQVFCAYAQPLKRGETGTRRFFVNQAGDVMQSPNEVAKVEGAQKGIDPRSAFRGDGSTSRVAVGSTGRDGDIWKVVN